MRRFGSIIIIVRNPSPKIVLGPRYFRIISCMDVPSKDGLKSFSDILAHIYRVDACLSSVDNRKGNDRRFIAEGCYDR